MLQRLGLFISCMFGDGRGANVILVRAYKFSVRDLFELKSNKSINQLCWTRVTLNSLLRLINLWPSDGFCDDGFWREEKNGVKPLGRDPTDIWRRVQESNPGKIGGRLVLSPLRHPSSQIILFKYGKLVVILLTNLWRYLTTDSLYTVLFYQPWFIYRFP